jgi:hypothetical protein
MYQAMEQARFASLQRKNSMEQARFADLEISNPMDQVMKQARLAFAGLETSDPMNLAAREARFAELTVLEAKQTKSTKLLTDSKKIKTVFEKETHNLIMPSKDPIIDKMLSTLPEDLQAILEDMQKRWIKKQYSPQKIRYLTFRYLFDMILGYVKSQIENIWF